MVELQPSGVGWGAYCGQGMGETKSFGREPRDLKVGRLLNEYLDRRTRGEADGETEFLARHADVAEELREHLDLLRSLEASHLTVDELIARGILAKSAEPGCLAELGEYQITGLIGRGGMGIVFKAREPSLNRTVALKLLRPDLAGDKIALARFAREARAAGAMRHANIVTIYAVGKWGNGGGNGGQRGF